MSNYAALKAKGVEKIVCISVNDPYVMDAWGKDLNCDGKVTMLADTNAEFTTALGMASDKPALGGTRSKRYALVIEGGVIKQMAVDESGIEKTTAESMLEVIGGGC